MPSRSTPGTGTTTATTATTAGPSRRISDVVEVNGTPGTPQTGAGATPPLKLPVRADPTREYVAGGHLEWFQNIPHSLPWAIDDVTTDFGDDLYERMALYPQIVSCLNVLRTGILEDGVNLAPAVDDKEDPKHGKAQDILDVCERMLDDLTPSLDDVLWDMLNAIAYGNKVAEQIYALDTTYAGSQQLVLRSLAVRPRISTAFVVDAFMNTLGLLGLIPGQAMPVLVGYILTDFDNVPNLLPREKFAVLSFRPKDRDPRGTSVLRPAFDPWNMALQMAPEFLKYLTQWASPSVLGFTAPEAQVGVLTDVNGNPVVNPETGLPWRPEDAMLAALLQFRNGTAAVFPDGASVTALEMAGDGSQFLTAFDRFDEQITKAILNQTLATEEGQHQARAAASVHQDVLGTIIRQAKRAVCRMLERDVLRPFIRYNYGDQAARDFTPTVQLGVTEQQDLTGLMQSVAALHNADYIAPSQFSYYDGLLGAPAREADEIPDVPIKETVTAQVPGVVTTGQIAHEGDQPPAAQQSPPSAQQQQSPGAQGQQQQQTPPNKPPPTAKAAARGAQKPRTPPKGG